jgi:hypothetical protein
MQASDLQWREVYAPTAAQENQNALSFNVPRDMPERRLYLYLEAALSSSSPYFIDASVSILDHGQPVGHYPVSIADFSGLTPNQSVISLVNCGGSPTGDSIAVRLAQKLNSTSPDVVVMQPIRVSAQITEIRLGIRAMWGSTLTGFRALMACLSTRQ